MNVTVVDASALAAILFKEPERRAVAHRLEGARLAAPALLEFEIVNVCVTKLRRNPELRTEILQGFALRAALPVEPHEIDSAGTLALAERLGLSGYDASYLWLAQCLNAELVTLDRRLERAAELLRQAARKPPST